MAKPPVTWTLPARLDLLKALEYLVRKLQAPRAAADLIDRLEEAAASLADSPQRGRIVPELGPQRRELLVKGYRLVYRIRSEVEILRLIHSRQDFLKAWNRTDSE